MKPLTPLQNYVLKTMDILKLAKENHLDDQASKYIVSILSTINQQNDWINALKTHFRLKLIQNDSMFGTTLKGMIRSDSEIQTNYQIVIKTASENNENYTIRYEFDILHEVIIGFALNTLQKETQCFASMIGYLFKRQSNTYHALNVQTYIKGTSLCSLLKTYHPFNHAQTILHIVLQLAHALHIAQTKLQFMHWDLHGDNVICMPLLQPQTITLTFSPTVSIVLHDVLYIPVCIDYGVSTCIFNNTLVINKYAAATPTEEDTNVLWLSTKENSHMLPLFDFYRYITYCIVKSPQFPASIIPCLCSYLFHSQNTDAILKQSLRYLQNQQYEEYREYYTKQKCSYPHKDNGTFFKEGNLIEWVKQIITEAPIPF